MGLDMIHSRLSLFTALILLRNTNTSMANYASRRYEETEVLCWSFFHYPTNLPGKRFANLSFPRQDWLFNIEKRNVLTLSWYYLWEWWRARHYIDVKFWSSEYFVCRYTCFHRPKSLFWWCSPMTQLKQLHLCTILIMHKSSWMKIHTLKMFVGFSVVCLSYAWMSEWKSIASYRNMNYSFDVALIRFFYT